ncbi:MAG: pseudouridine synthase [Bacteroidota bacterium]|nr:pseudouridine synthase [Bacteroidota bacterium]
MSTIKGDEKKYFGEVKVRLNKYISNSGFCSRREADKHILKGLITVNDKIVKDLGIKIYSGDSIKYRGKIIKEKNFDYFLLNKPKGFIVTNQGGIKIKFLKSLFEKNQFSKIIAHGDMGKLVSGLLILTNDLELIKKLNQPKCKINMIYQLTLDKKIRNEHIDELKKGIILEKEKYFIKELECVDNIGANNVIGVKVFSIMPSILIKMFKKLDYKILAMDRVVFAGFTKKDLPRGRWRILDSKEVGFLKML